MRLLSNPLMIIALIAAAIASGAGYYAADIELSFHHEQNARWGPVHSGHIVSVSTVNTDTEGFLSRKAKVKYGGGRLAKLILPADMKVGQSVRFWIDASHNTTANRDNEWSDSGAIGLGIGIGAFVWLIAFVGIFAFLAQSPRKSRSLCCN